MDQFYIFTQLSSGDSRNYGVANIIILADEEEEEEKDKEEEADRELELDEKP